jgi:hypothetical protein
MPPVRRSMGEDLPADGAIKARVGKKDEQRKAEEV